MYGDVVLGMKPVNKEDVDPFEAIIEDVKHAKGVQLDNELEVEYRKELVKKFKAAVKEQTGKEMGIRDRCGPWRRNVGRRLCADGLQFGECYRSLSRRSCLEWRIPVSYTHLDVYKRQGKGCS